MGPETGLHDRRSLVRVTAPGETDSRGRNATDRGKPQAVAAVHRPDHHIGGGKGANTVVTDLEGGNQRTVDIGRGGGGMTLGPDGTKPYVALVDSELSEPDNVTLRIRDLG